MAVSPVDVLEGDDVVAGEKPRLGFEGGELGPGRADLRGPLRAAAGAAPGDGASTTPRCSLAF